MNLAFAAVLFDLDGVLADSEAWWDQIDGDLLAEQGVDYGGEHKHEVMGKSFNWSLKFYKGHFRLHAELHDLEQRRRTIAARYYKEHILPFEDASAVLLGLWKGGYTMALATSSVRAVVEPFLLKHDLSRFFAAVITGEDVTNGKPAPDIYLKAMTACRAEPQRCLVVEDALAGVAAGKAAGAAVAAIPDPRFAKRGDYKGKADFILNSIGELPGLLARLTT